MSAARQSHTIETNQVTSINKKTASFLAVTVKLKVISGVDQFYIENHSDHKKSRHAAG
jgi:hypothetical protein